MGVFGIVNLVGNFGTVFCDQAYWQSSVAAKPLQGVWGFIAGGLCWFAIPFGLATTMGLAYLGLSSAQGSPLLSDEDIMKGLAAPLVAQKLLGPVGEYSMLFLILMAVMSTGSAEIIAVASIVIYDVYQTYICPFRRDHRDGQCILCGRFLRQQKEDEGRTEVCSCPSAESCQACKEDTLARAQSKNVVKPHYTCKAHGAYKEYQEHLLNYKNWCIILCTFLSIPLCLFCWAVDLNLAWTYYFTGILISSSVIPIAMSILWARATSYGLVSGVVGGCLSGMAAWVSYASTFPGGLSAATFVKNLSLLCFDFYFFFSSLIYFGFYFFFFSLIDFGFYFCSFFFSLIYFCFFFFSLIDFGFYFDFCFDFDFGSGFVNFLHCTST